MDFKDYRIARKHFIKILFAGYRISYFKGILSIEKCYNIEESNNIEESIIFAYNNKKVMNRFIQENIEIYRRKNSNRNECFIIDVLKEFRVNKHELKILAIDYLSQNDIEIICIKDKFEYKIFTKLFDTSSSRRKNEIDNIKKLFPKIKLEGKNE